MKILLFLFCLVAIESSGQIKISGEAGTKRLFLSSKPFYRIKFEVLFSPDIKRVTNITIKDPFSPKVYKIFGMHENGTYEYDDYTKSGNGFFILAKVAGFNDFASRKYKQINPYEVIIYLEDGHDSDFDDIIIKITAINILKQPPTLFVATTDSIWKTVIYDLTLNENGSVIYKSIKRKDLTPTNVDCHFRWIGDTSDIDISIPSKLGEINITINYAETKYFVIDIITDSIYRLKNNEYISIQDDCNNSYKCLSSSNVIYSNFQNLGEIQIIGIHNAFEGKCNPKYIVIKNKNEPAYKKNITSSNLLIVKATEIRFK